MKFAPCNEGIGRTPGLWELDIPPILVVRFLADGSHP
jgi:hypothetical protein